ncbi:hypothetical protein VTL71DRAFT_7750 [Oculimacula yallundae]|uniref:DNA2/NAM7 helicase helicase domain-containing protein n=1 Tax=Oculimacula yallundae TaxID=86028 RepID=A0ABR4CVV4_9HELO
MSGNMTTPFSRAPGGLSSASDRKRALPKRKVQKLKDGLFWADFLNAPQGQDVPNRVLDVCNALVEVKLAVCYQSAQEEGKVSPPPLTRIFHGFDVQFDASSNTPGFLLVKDGYVLPIHSENFAQPSGSFDAYSVLRERSYDMTPTTSDESLSQNSRADAMNLVEVFQTDHSIPGMKSEDAKDLLSFGRDVANGKRRGIHCFSFRSTGSAYFGKIPDNVSQDAEELLNLVNKGVQITVIRQLLHQHGWSHAYWTSRVAVAIQKGVWSYYKDVLGQHGGRLFEDWVKNPDKVLKRQIWMETPQIRGSKKLPTYASQVAKYSFGSMREFEVVQSAAIIYENMHDRKSMERLFDSDVLHKAKVLANINGYITLDIKATRQNDIVIPPIFIDTKVTVKRVVTYDMKKEGHPRAYAGMEYTGHTIRNHLAKGDFCISFTIEDINDWACYKTGANIKIVLTITENVVPLRAQLSAISTVCKTPNSKSSWKFKASQDFLRGIGDPEYTGNLSSVVKDAKARIADAAWDDYREYKARLGLDASQNEYLEAVFDHDWLLTQLHGPLGSGKTYTASAIAMSFGLLQVRTAVCAPSCAATLKCLKAVVTQLTAAAAINPNIVDTVKVVFIPTTATTKVSVSKSTNFLQAAYDMLGESETSTDDPYKEYMLYSHVLKSFEHRIELQIGDVPSARAWIQTRKDLLLGISVSSILLKQFVDLATAEAEAVLKDLSVRVVISTFNTARQMIEYGWRPYACVMDDCDAATEQENLVPLSLGARFSCLIGNHEQQGPNVRSEGHNEFADQLGVSLFRRTWENGNVPRHQLEHGYHDQSRCVSRR